MRRLPYVLTLGVASLFASARSVDAGPFQLIVAEAPVGSGAGQPIERYFVDDTFGTMTRLSDIPANLTNDPLGIVFRSPGELYVGNRAGHSGNGSIATFIFDAGYNHFAPGPVITGNGVTDCAQLVFNQVDGELFQTNWSTGVLSRFKFSGGTAIPNGTITMPDAAYQLGVAIRPVDQQLFVSSYQGVRRFGRNPDGTYSHIATFNFGAGNVHFLKFRDDELYACDISSNAIYRFYFDGTGTPVLKHTIPSTHVIDCAFSPDGQEMFAANHFDGGITRYQYSTGTDTWTPFGDVVPTPQLGGLATGYFPCNSPADDTDSDGDVDIDDFLKFQSCFNGPDVPYITGPACGCLDFDHDGDIDVTDFVQFQACFNGPDQPPACS